MFGFHKPKMYRSVDGCCICRAKSSSSRFTDSQRYQRDLRSCFGLGQVRYGDMCNACVLLVKRWKKLPAGSKKNWNHVVDTKGGSSLKTTLKMMKRRRRKNQPSHNSLAEKRLTTQNSDAHSSSSTSPAQSPSYSNQSDEGSDTEPASGTAHSPAFTFLDLTYWKRRRVCCGIVYAGRYGEVIIDPQLFKPCCRKLPTQVEQQEVEQQQEEVEQQQVEQQQEVEEVEQQKVEQQEVEVEEEQRQVVVEQGVEQQQQVEEGHTETARSSQLPQVKQEVSVEDRKERR